MTFVSSIFRLFDRHGGGKALADKKVSCHDPIDEVLEVVWILKEDGEEVSADRIISRNVHNAIGPSLLDQIVDDGYLVRDGERYDFTDSGKERGEKIIRQHRLAERLLVDVLGMHEMSIESDACRFEHFLSPEVSDHICTLLGHPKKCPHGKPIPPGPCCIRAQRQVETAVVPLSELRSGQSGRIVYISTPHHQRLDRLTSLGLFPGRVVKVHQREPLFIIFLDETQLALEHELVEEVYVIRN